MEWQDEGLRGTRPSAPQDQRTASTYIFGAICPVEGKAAGLVLPWCNTEAMTLHLAENSARVAPAGHAALLVDQAGWHLSERLVVPANITIVPLPGKCPELNPRENVGNSHETTGCRTGCSPSTPKSSTTRARSARVMSAHPARQPERRLDSSNRIRRVETPA